MPVARRIFVVAAAANASHIKGLRMVELASAFEESAPIVIGVSRCIFKGNYGMFDRPNGMEADFLRLLGQLTRLNPRRFP